jgi:uncharacterized small protein (DUF1192 family)
MASDDDNEPRRKTAHEIGQDLSLLSVEELEARVALLSGEIERLKVAAAARRATRDAAERLFKA